MTLPNKKQARKLVVYLIIILGVVGAGYWLGYNRKAVTFCVSNPQAVELAADYYAQKHKEADKSYGQVFFISPLSK